MSIGIPLAIRAVSSGHSCPECNESFPTVALYRKHLAEKNHKETGAICDVCGAMFGSVLLLKGHMSKMHRKGRALMPELLCTRMY